jgi:ferredoxin-type protein NapH
MHNAYAAGESKRKLKQFVSALVFAAVLSLGWIYPLLGYFIPLCMLLGMGIAFFKGRKWCDWACPRGSFYDVLIKPISAKREIPHFFKSEVFRIAALVLLMAVMGINLVLRWPDPYRIGRLFVTLLTTTTAIGVGLALFVHQRTWCSFCPIGSLAHWVGGSNNFFKIDSRKCVECKLCHKVCPIQLSPYKFKKESLEIIRESDCLACNLCVMVCPKKALSR